MPLDLSTIIGDLVEKIDTMKPNRTLFVVSFEKIREVILRLLDKLGKEGFTITTIEATDFPSENKIRIDYYCTVLPEEKIIVLRTFIPRDKPEIDSLIDLIPGVLPGEREAHDLVGVVFRGNPALKRPFFAPVELVEKGIYPLRKDSGV